MKIYSLLVLLAIVACNQPASNKVKSTKNINDQLSKYAKLGKLHKKLGITKPGDWLYQHNEKGQSFGNYIKGDRICPNDSLNKIVILPLGKFTDLEKNLLKETANYVSIFFSKKTELLGAISDKLIPKESRRANIYGEQLNTKYILSNILLNNIPDSAISFIAITNKDLYPNDNWNFVFGEASLKKRTGVSSYRRYYENNFNKTNYTICFERIIKTTTHELCHMFSLKHCRIYNCLLNGSNSMEEADIKPLWLCPECLAKLQNCLNFELIERYDNLIVFFSKNQMPAEVLYYQKSKQLMQK